MCEIVLRGGGRSDSRGEIRHPRVPHTHTRRVEYVLSARLRGSRQLDAPRTIFRENRNKCREFSGMGLYESVHRMSDDGLTTGKMTNDHPGWGGELNFLLPGFFFFFLFILYVRTMSRLVESTLGPVDCKVFFIHHVLPFHVSSGPPPSASFEVFYYKHAYAVMGFTHTHTHGLRGCVTYTWARTSQYAT